MNNSIVLSVGDSHHLRFGKDRIVYVGMPSEKVYSIAQMKYQFPCQGYAWNLFFHKEQSRIRVDGVNLIVESVTPEEIRLNF